jgi:hypothetical protein
LAVVRFLCELRAPRNDISVVEWPTQTLSAQNVAVDENSNTFLLRNASTFSSGCA